MKKKTSVRKICSRCRLILRRKRVLVICPNLKHKQRQA